MRAQDVIKGIALMLFAGTMVAASGCGSRTQSDTNGGREYVKQNERVRNQNVDFASMDVRGFDINGDGTPDVLHYSRDGVVRVERYDLNFDGQIDMDVYYGPDGVLNERAFYLNDDDGVDVIGLYEKEKMVEKHVSIDFDGRFPIVKHYDGEGDLMRVERDSSGDGRTDIWEYYDGGELVRVARDTDGDGVPDQVSEIQ